MRGSSRAALAASRERLDEVVDGLADDKVTQVGNELLAAVHLFDAELRLRRAITDPGVDAEQRAGLMRALVGGRVLDETARVLDAIVRQSWSVSADAVDTMDEMAAQALFTVAERHEQLDDVEDAFFRFGRIVDREPSLRAALSDRALPADRKTGVLDNLLGGKVPDAMLTLTREVVLHPRGRTLDRGIDEYAQLAAARRGRLVARVRTAVDPTAEQIERLQSALAAQLGHHVHVNIEIDPTMVGGITVRVGDELFDGSIAHRIAEARRYIGA
jgi:F-type H+-transporting ATPase subunit delta